MNLFDPSQPLRILHAPPIDADDGPWLYEPEGPGADEAELDAGDDDYSLDFDDEYLDALLLDDDYEPTPEAGDFWPDSDAA